MKRQEAVLMNRLRSCQIKIAVPFAGNHVRRWIQSNVVDTLGAIWKRLPLLLCLKFMKNGNSIPVALVNSLHWWHPGLIAINAQELVALNQPMSKSSGSGTRDCIMRRPLGAAKRPLIPPAVALGVPGCFSILCYIKDIWNMSTLSTIRPWLAR